MRLDGRTQHVELVHRLMVSNCIILSDFHRLEVFKTGFLCNFVLAFVGVMFEVADIGDVAHITHLITEMFQIAVHEVEGDCRACVAEVGVTVDGRAADIHSDMAFMNRFERLLHASQAVVNI